jgi:imidazolonepropionase-like amidohydrolase
MKRATLGFGLMVLSMFISADTLIRDARVIDGTGAPALETTSIWIKDGYIREIGRELDVTEATRVVDASDMTIIPGLIDSHVHLFSLPGAPFRNESEAEKRELRRIHLRAYLANGVTSVLDTGISFEHLAETRGSLASGVPGPRVYALGPPLSAPGGYADDRPESYAFNFNARNADAVDVMIDQLVSAGTVGVKVKIEYGFGPFNVWPVHSPEVREALVNAAAERNLPLYIHSMSEPEHHIALDMKPHALVHAGFFEGEPTTLLLDRMRESGAYVVSTISVADAGRVFAQPELLKAPHVQLTVPVAEIKTASDPKSAAGLAVEFARASFPQWMPQSLAIWIAGVLQSSPTAIPMQNAVGQMHGAGIPIVMGSDSGNWEVIPFEFHGPTSVREVELLNLAGMTKMEAIVASTSIPAQMLGLDGEIGTITVGARADLVILPDNPLTDLTVLTRPTWVMKSGELRTPREWMGVE